MSTWQEDLVAQLQQRGFNAPQASDVPTAQTIRHACDEFINWGGRLDDFTIFVLSQLSHVPNVLVASGLCPSWPTLLTMIPDHMDVFHAWDKFREALQAMRNLHGNRGSADLDMETALDGILAA